MKRARHQQGSVVFNRRSKTWHYLWNDNGGRRSKLIGSERDYPSKASAWEAADTLKRELETPVSQETVKGTITVRFLVERYKTERLPSRIETARVYCSWLDNHILPYWGERPVSDVQPRETELWLRRLKLSSKSRSHVRNMLRTLIDFAMWCGELEIARNPVDLVVVRGASKRVRSPRSLRVEEFQALMEHLKEPFRTMACTALCFGLRISEVLALRWADVDWLKQTLTVERGIVKQNVDDVKTGGSRKRMRIGPELVETLRVWKQTTQFPSDTDWIFASPAKLGRLPYSYTGVWRELQSAANRAGIRPLGTHAFRHTYRSWLDAVGTPIAVQQKLMRHSDIRTTLNIYGDVVTDEMAEANAKVAELALGRPPN